MFIIGYFLSALATILNYALSLLRVHELRLIQAVLQDKSVGVGINDG